MRFLVEDNSMAVITGAGAEYGDPREKHIIHSDSQTFIRCFCLYMSEYLWNTTSTNKYRALYQSYLLLISASVGVTTARILGTRLIRGCHQVPTQMTHDHPQGNLKSFIGFWI